ncbi:hypothetical protein B5M42_015635 [Paenibacillus athensensis]|uniref:Uncharacterized protein n=1 Tax=Paenibacillus athensensis TaxID=1967502 RepID=A0A4Y8Q984_9BACL|nr:hypothetical protein [Paenibacillus athensensis]MCD1260243.1 hypothetical protein [Paenibacillus athensensis]
MFNKLIKKILGNKPKTGSVVVIQLNDKIRPMDRGDVYEDPLDDLLKSHKWGEVIGGGTMLEESGEIMFCNIEVLIYSGNNEEKIIQQLIDFLEQAGAPYGSHVTLERSGVQINFGKKEGIGIYLDGIHLPDDVYRECDSNVVLSEISRLIDYTGEAQRFWQGDTETALYFYGESFEQMKKAIAEFTTTYPLCQNARIIQIA